MSVHDLFNELTRRVHAHCSGITQSAALAPVELQRVWTSISPIRPAVHCAGRVSAELGVRFGFVWDDGRMHPSHRCAR